jgi:hypothetical protein
MAVATWRWEGRHRYVPNAVNSVKSAAAKGAGLPSLVPAGTRLRLWWAELGVSVVHQVVITLWREPRPSGIRRGRSTPGA